MRGGLASEGSRTRIGFFTELAATLSAASDVHEVIRILTELDAPRVLVGHGVIVSANPTCTAYTKTPEVVLQWGLLRRIGIIEANAHLSGVHRGEILVQHTAFACDAEVLAGLRGKRFTTAPCVACDGPSETPTAPFNNAFFARSASAFAAPSRRLVR
ncbi:hypothetical protein DFH09DRAFT_1311194 [Mycena vulgaris]|nr:hypothetical protein DFH09DRAFT_1311194 [Mycena vulgaris]